LFVFLISSTTWAMGFVCDIGTEIRLEEGDDGYRLIHKSWLADRSEKIETLVTNMSCVFARDDHRIVDCVISPLKNRDMHVLRSKRVDETFVNNQGVPGNSDSHSRSRLTIDVLIDNDSNEFTSGDPHTFTFDLSDCIGD